MLINKYPYMHGGNRNHKNSKGLYMISKMHGGNRKHKNLNILLKSKEPKEMERALQ